MLLTEYKRQTYIERENHELKTPLSLATPGEILRKNLPPAARAITSPQSAQLANIGMGAECEASEG